MFHMFLRVIDNTRPKSISITKYSKRNTRTYKISIVCSSDLFGIMLTSSPMSMMNFSLYNTINAQNNYSNSGNSGSNNGSTLPSLSIYSKSNGQFIEELKPRYMHLMISFSNSGAGTSTITNDPNFMFNTYQWPSIVNGEIINTVFGGSSSLIQPTDVRITLTNVLNPSQSTDYNSMQL